MYRLNSTLRFIGPVQPNGLSSRAWGRVRKAAIADGLTFWHDWFAPAHFQAGAAERYGYRERRPGYSAWKALTGKPPLVMSQTTREDVSRAVTPADIKSYPTRAVLTLHVPQYMAINYRPGGRHPQTGKELLTVRADEQQIVAGVIQRKIVEGLAAERGETEFQT